MIRCRSASWVPALDLADLAAVLEKIQAVAQPQIFRQSVGHQDEGSVVSETPDVFEQKLDLLVADGGSRLVQ